MWFVSRAALDAERTLAKQWEDWCRDLVNESDAQRRRYDALLEKYHALKLAGASTPAPAPAPLPRTPANPLDEVIGTVAGTNSRLRKQLKDFAAIQRFQGADEQEITHMLLNWSEDDAGVPE